MTDCDYRGSDYEEYWLLFIVAVSMKSTGFCLSWQWLWRVLASVYRGSDYEEHWVLFIVAVTMKSIGFCLSWQWLWRLLASVYRGSDYEEYWLLGCDAVKYDRNLADSEEHTASMFRVED
jgi:hypothetical protein